MSLKFTEALDIILNKLDKGSYEKVSVYESLGRVIAGKVLSTRSLPPLDNSAMDGYAIIHSDIKKYPMKLDVVGNIAAGSNIDGLKLETGKAFRIMTGAFIPVGADTVIPHELTDNGKEVVTLNDEIKAGANIRNAGTDIKIGDEIDFIGETVTAYHIARLVSAGIFYISVYRKINIAVISTGDEITDLSDYNSPLKTFDSNGVGIKQLLPKSQCNVDYLGVVEDDLEKLLAVFKSAEKYDMIVTSAGISVGDFDLLHEVADTLKIEWLFNNINQKPGQHFAFGYYNSTPIFATPGNPVSAMFCTYLYVLSAIRKMGGVSNFYPKPVKARLTKEIIKKKGRTEFERVTVAIDEEGLIVTPLSNQESYKISSLTTGNAFALFGSDLVGDIKVGTMINCYIYNSDKLFYV